MIKTPDTIHNLRDVNAASPTEDDVLTYNAVTKLWGAEAAAGGGAGDMTKAVYDIDADGVVDNSEKLEASTKAQVQDHAPKAHASSHEDVGADEISVAGLTGLLATAQTPAAHTHVEADVTDLDHNAQKIKSKTVDAPQVADDGKFLQYDHANSKFVLTAGGGGADYPMKLKPDLTRWVMPGWYSQGYITVAAYAGNIYYLPIFVSETTTYIAIGINVATAKAGTADLRIFNWSDGVPGSLVLNAGTVDTGTTGVKEINISQQLARGYYFLAVRCSGSPSLRGLDKAKPVAPPVSGINTVTTYPDAPNVILIVSAAYADPAPAPTAINTVYYAFVHLREN